MGKTIRAANVPQNCYSAKEACVLLGLSAEEADALCQKAAGLFWDEVEQAASRIAAQDAAKKATQAPTPAKGLRRGANACATPDAANAQNETPPRTRGRTVEEKRWASAKANKESALGRAVRLASHAWGNPCVDEDGRPLGMKYDPEKNAFYWNGKTRGAALMFRVFTALYFDKKRVRGEWAVSFGVTRTALHTYLKTGRAHDPNRNGKLATHDSASTRTARTHVTFQGGGEIFLPKNAVWQRFTDGLDRANAGASRALSRQEAVLLALDEYMTRRADVFAPRASLEEIDRAPVPARYLRGGTLRVYLNAETRTRLYACLRRWNASGHVPLTLSDAADAAILLWLNAMPPEYADPEMAKAMAAAKNG